MGHTLSNPFHKEDILHKLAEIGHRILAFFHPKRHQVTVKSPVWKGRKGLPMSQEEITSQLHEIRKAIHELSSNTHLSPRRKRRIAEKLRRKVMKMVEKSGEIMQADFKMK